MRPGHPASAGHRGNRCDSMTAPTRSVPCSSPRRLGRSERSSPLAALWAGTRDRGARVAGLWWGPSSRCAAVLPPGPRTSDGGCLRVPSSRPKQPPGPTPPKRHL